MIQSADLLANEMNTLRYGREKVCAHALFPMVSDLMKVRIFMEAHVFAVWDFMSLLKTLQIQLTCVQVPWAPVKNPEVARMINEIVLTEECDEIQPGVFLSHFELYVRAMQECGAETDSINHFIALVSSGEFVDSALESSGVALYIQRFVQTTLTFCKMPPHQVAAAFFYGREDIIAEMFTSLKVENPLLDLPEMQMFKLYLNRHIEIDGHSHGPMALQLMRHLCGADPKKWAEAKDAAQAALSARAQLWDGVLASFNVPLSL